MKLPSTNFLRSFYYFFSLFFFTSIALCFVSCGYHMGSMMHPQVSSIAIAEIRNDTKEPNLSAIARNQIAAQFQLDNSLKLTTKEKADCILYCRIVNAKQTTSRYTPSTEDDSYEPAEFSYTVSAEFEVVVPGHSKPLIPKRSVSGSSKFYYNGDPESGKRGGMRQACFELSKQIVEYTTEAW